MACRGPDADVLRGCPECEVTLLYKEFEEELLDEMGRLAEDQKLCPPGRGRDYKWRWSKEKLIRDVGSITSMDIRVDGKGYDENWTVPVKNLVSILRQEQALQDRIDMDEAKQEAQNARRDRQ